MLSAEVSFLQHHTHNPKLFSFFHVLFIYTNNIQVDLCLLFLPPGISKDVKEELWVFQQSISY